MILSTPPEIEVVDVRELARRLGVTENWVFDHTTRREFASDHIPHFKFGRFTRYAWGSPELMGWLDRHKFGGKPKGR